MAFLIPVLSGLVCVGTAVYPDDGVHADVLLDAADRRMYGIKRLNHALQAAGGQLFSPLPAEAGLLEQAATG